MGWAPVRADKLDVHMIKAPRQLFFSLGCEIGSWKLGPGSSGLGIRAVFPECLVGLVSI